MQYQSILKSFLSDPLSTAAYIMLTTEDVVDASILCRACNCQCMLGQRGTGGNAITSKARVL